MSLLDTTVGGHGPAVRPALVTATAAAIELRDGSRLLDQVSVTIRAGEVVGIVGPSGSGKTTLLEVLAGIRRPTSGVVDTVQHDRPMGYVPQDDIVHRDLSVGSTVRSAARLRLPSQTSRGEIEATVERTLALVGLSSRRDLAVGALSGGQRKRVSIATELVVRPGVCLLDEPTAGLDPVAAAALVDALRSLADHGTSIVMTTHNLADLRVADRVIVLAVGGRIVFDGAPHEAAEHLGGFTIAGPPPAREADGAFTDAGMEAVVSAEHSTGRRSWLQQTAILTRRNLDLVLRSRMSLAIMTGSPLLVVAMFSVLFPAHAFDSGAHHDPATMLAVTYWLAFAGFFFGLTFGLLQICTELAIVRRERLVTIDIGPYLVAKLAVLLPFLAIVNAVMVVTLRCLHRLPASGLGDTATLWGLLGADALAGLTLGLLASASVTGAAQAALALPMLCFPAVLFSGAILPVSSMTEVGSGIAAVISDRWAFEAMARSLAVAGGRSAGPLIGMHRGALSGPLTTHVLIIVGLAVVFLALAWSVLDRRTRPAAQRGRPGEGRLRTLATLHVPIRRNQP